jgi:hypothetical protein
MDTANSTVDFLKSLPPWDESALSSPHNFATWDSYFELPNASLPPGRKNPEQSDASALEALETEIRSPLGLFDGGWNPSGLAMEPAYPDKVSTPSAPATRSTPGNAESKQPETGSYDTTRSMYFYPDKSHVDTRQRAQTPTIRRPERPLSPTTMTVAPQQRNTSDSGDALDPAMKHSQTADELKEKYSRTFDDLFVSMKTNQGRLISREEKPAGKKAKVHMKKNRTSSSPPPQENSPDDTSPLTSASHPAPMSPQSDGPDPYPRPPPFLRCYNEDEEREILQYYR